MNLSELFDNMFNQYNEFILQADDFLEKMKEKEKDNGNSVYS